MARDERVTNLIDELKYGDDLTGAEHEIRKTFFDAAVALINSIPVDSAELFTSLRNIRAARDHALLASKVTE